MVGEAGGCSSRRPHLPGALPSLGLGFSTAGCGGWSLASPLLLTSRDRGHRTTPSSFPFEPSSDLFRLPPRRWRRRAARLSVPWHTYAACLSLHYSLNICTKTGFKPLSKPPGAGEGGWLACQSHDTLHVLHSQYETTLFHSPPQALEKAGGIVENITWELFRETLIEQAEQARSSSCFVSSLCPPSVESRAVDQPLMI